MLSWNTGWPASGFSWADPQKGVTWNSTLAITIHDVLAFALVIMAVACLDLLPARFWRELEQGIASGLRSAASGTSAARLSLNPPVHDGFFGREGTGVAVGYVAGDRLPV